jgi:hypothetical protein
LTVENGIFPFCFVYPTTEAKYELDFNHLLWQLRLKLILMLVHH